MKRLSIYLILILVILSGLYLHTVGSKILLHPRITVGSKILLHPRITVGSNTTSKVSLSHDNLRLVGTRLNTNFIDYNPVLKTNSRVSRMSYNPINPMVPRTRNNSRDSNVAMDVSALVRNQIMAQRGVSQLATANTLPDAALTLIR